MVRSSSGLTIRVALAGVLLLARPALSADDRPQANAHAPEVPFRIAFTTSMFHDVNENDARASVNAWATTLAKGRGLRVTPDVQVLPDAESLRRAVEEDRVDAAGMTAFDFLATGGEEEWSPIFGPAIRDTVADQYRLLVHRDRHAESLGDLKNCTVLIHHNPRAGLGALWLDDRLRHESLPEAGLFLRSETQVSSSPGRRGERVVSHESPLVVEGRSS